MAKKFTAVRGMKDILPNESGKWRLVQSAAARVFEYYGYEEIRTPVIENAELFIRSVGEATDVVEKQMYVFDSGDEKLALRPEGTASVVRAYIESGTCVSSPLARYFYFGPMFRHERPQKGRQREFYQIGAELLGSKSPAADAEIIALAIDVIRSLQIKDFRLEINSIGSKEGRENYNKALVSYLQGHIQKLSEDSKRRLEKNPLRILDSKDEADKEIVKSAPRIHDYLSDESKAHFAEVRGLLAKIGIDHVVNENIVRGLDYYEETAFEIIATGLGAQDAVAGGGRYNGLVKDLGGPDIQGIGFALGVERALLLSNLTQKPSDAIYACTLDAELVGEAFAIVQKLRADGLRVEWDYEQKSLKSALKKADKMNAESVIIVGKNEWKDGVVIVRDMRKGAQHMVKPADLPMHFVNIGG